MKSFVYILVLFIGTLLSFNSYGQIAGTYSIGGPSTLGQFPDFTGPLNSKGTISCDTGSVIVTGVGTAFTTAFQVDDYIYDAGGWVNGTVIGQVANIQSNTKLTLYSNAALSETAGSKYCGPDAPCAFAAINAYGLSDSITLTLNANVMEPGTNSLKKWPEVGQGGYKVFINCYWGNTIDGSNVPANAAGVIRLDGCSRVSIIGGDPWGNNLTFRNENNKGPDLIFINGASNNTIGPACNFENQNTNTVAGTNVGAIMFGTTTGSAGNSNNIITGCSVRNRSDTTLVAHEGLYSQGSAQYPNANNTIVNCDFDNLENYGIWVTGTGNGDGWKIKGSNFHWDNVTPATTDQAGIYFNPGITSNNDSISGNYIGRDGPVYWYGEWVNNGAAGFVGIYASTGTTGATSITNNMVAHVQMTNVASTNLYGIQAAGGLLNIKGNGIGDPYWLYIGPQNTLTLSGTGTLAGIYVTGAGGALPLNIDSNQVYALSRYKNTTGAGSNGQLVGIGVANTVTTSVNITGNTIAALTDSSSKAGVGNLSSVSGIYDYATGMGQNIYNNNISDLENMYVGANVISITGIALSGPATNTSPFNVCARNSIYIDGNCRNGATLEFANINGIDIQGAAYDIVNNMIMLGYDEFWYANGNPYIVSGIKKSTASAYINNIYYNSVFIVGSSNSATARNSYCYNASGAANTADKIKNNVFFNARNNTGAAGTHYAMFYNTNNIFDYNDYMATGAGGKLSNGNDTVPLMAGQDAHSLNVDPDFLEEHCQPCPWDNLHLNTGCALGGMGVDLSANTPPYTEDYDGQKRNKHPFIGGDEFPFTLVVSPVSPVNICAGGSASLSADGFCPGSTYVWSPSGGLSATDVSNPTASPTATTTYTVTATNTYGYTGSATVVVNVGTSITIAPHPTYCTADSTGGVPYKTAPLTYNSSTGDPDKFTVIWDSAAHKAGFADDVNVAFTTSPILLPVPAAVNGTFNGTITVKNSGSGCVSKSVSFTLTTVSAIPQNLAVVATPSAPPHEGDNVVLRDSINPSFPASSYAWYHWLSPVGVVTTYTDSLIKNPVVYNGTGISGAGVTWILVFASNACGVSYPGGFYTYDIVPKYISTNPSNCGTTDGSIVFTGLNPPGFDGYVSDYDISYSFNGAPQTTIESLTADSAGNETWGNLPAGIYTNIQLYWARNGHTCGCVTPSAPIDTIILVKPACDSLPTITLGNDPKVCFSPSVQTANLTYSATAQSPDEYKIVWGNTAIAAGFTNVVYASKNLTASPVVITVPAGAAANSYNGTLTVRNFGKGTESKGYAINIIVNAQPSISATSFSVCNGGSSSGFNATCTLNCDSIINYTWSPSSTLSASTGTNPSASPATTTTYTVTGTNKNSTCFATATAVVTVNTSVTPSVSITSTEDTVCTGTPVSFSSFELNGGNSPSYQWKKNGTDVGNNSTTYVDNGLVNNDVITCLMKSNASCATDSNANSNSITITVSSSVKAGTISIANDTVCVGTPAVLTLSKSSGKIHWQSSLTPGNFVNIAGASSSTYASAFSATSYFRAYVTNGACSDTSPIFKLIVEPAPVPAFTDSVSGMNVIFNSSGSQGALFYTWDFGDQTGSNDPNPSHTYDSVKTYDVCLTVSNSSNCNVILCLNVSTYPTGINDLNNGGELKIYPNPFSDKVIVEDKLSSSLIESVEVYDLLGKKLLIKTYDTRQKNITMNLSGLPGSMYFIKVRTQNADYVEPLIKQ